MSFNRCRQPLRARAHRLTRHAMALAAALAGSLTPLTEAAGASQMDANLGEGDHLHGGNLPILIPNTIRDQWSGGSQSLPYGDRVDPGIVIGAARNLAATQPAVSEFIARGYVRRPDLDCAQAQRGYATAVLAFEKPGVSPAERQPCIEVVTRSILIDGADCPSTQVFGGMLVDSSGYVVPGDATTDGPLIVVPVAPAGAEGALPDPLDEDFVFKYSAREGIGEGTHFQTAMSPGALALYGAEARSVLNAEIEGVILGAAGGGGYIVLGAVVGMTFAARQFWISPPDTCGCGHRVIEAAPDALSIRPPAADHLIAPRRRGGRARVLDVQGRVVRDLGEADLDDRSPPAWDLTDASGHRAGAGIYFLSVRAIPPNAPGDRLVRRIIVTP